MSAGVVPAVVAGAVPAPRRPIVLEELLAAGRTLHQALEEAVLRYRLHGASWADVGRQLGIKRQSAHERFRYLDASPYCLVTVRIIDGSAVFFSEHLAEPIRLDRARGVLMPRESAAQLRELTPVAVVDGVLVEHA